MGMVIMGPFTDAQILRDLFFFGSGNYFMLSLFLTAIGYRTTKMFWYYIPIGGFIGSVVMLGMGVFGYLPGWIAINAIWPLGCAALMLFLFHEMDRTHNRQAYK